ncbi:MAG: sugar-binding protein [Chthoniobacteraceae bacterium]
MKKILPYLFAVCFCAMPAWAQDPTLSVTDKGVAIEANSMGSFTIEPAKLQMSGGKPEERPVMEAVAGGMVVAGYPSGAKLEYRLAPDRSEVVCTYSGLPAAASSFKSEMLFPIKFTQGGAYSFETEALKPLPAEKGEQFIQRGAGTRFNLLDAMGTGFTLTTTSQYRELQDNRVFNWPVFVYAFYHEVHANPGSKSFTIKIAAFNGDRLPAAGAPRKFIVDRFGQSALKDYPGKVKSVEELREDARKQEVALANAPDSGLDAYGGLAGSGKMYGLKKTGFFHVEKAGGHQVLVTPEGNMFFQLGVCSIANTDDFTQVKGRESIYEWLPKPGDEYDSAWREHKPDWGCLSFYIVNWIRKFGKPFTFDEWSGQVVDRLRSWGFNSAGAFSGYSPTMRAKNFPCVSFLPSGEKQGVKMLPDKIGTADLMDPFVPGTEAALDKAYAGIVAPQADDPLLVGYFLGNEQHFEILPKQIPTYKASKVAAKQRLVEMLQDRYGDIAGFNAAWNPARPFANFDELKEEPLFVRTDAAAADMRKFQQAYLEAYYSMIERVFRKYDKHHLLLGSRWTPGTATNEDVVRIGGKYLDVISINYYTYAIESGFLKQAHDWSGGRPILLSEWYFSCTDEGLGGGKEVKDQKERGAAYRNYVEQSAALPFVVGSEWFIYTDQSITGRFFEGFNGEGANTGLVDVTDRSYEPLVSACTQSHARIYDVMMGRQSPFVFADPRFNGTGAAGKTLTIPRALPGLKLDGTTTNWPGRPAEQVEPGRMVFGDADAKFRGDFRLCWDEKNLYFLIQVKDSTPGMNEKEGGALWNGDCVEIFLGGRNPDQKGSPIFSDRQILIGAGPQALIHVVDHPEEGKQCQAIVTKDVAGDGYVLEAAIPWKILGMEAVAGREMLFDVAIDNSDDGRKRRQQLVWNGTAKDFSDRGAWGRARLTGN